MILLCLATANHGERSVHVLECVMVWALACQAAMERALHVQYNCRHFERLETSKPLVLVDTVYNMINS
jgi:hypothetical protein